MYVDLCGPTHLEISGFDENFVEIRGNAGGEGFGPLQMLGASLGLCTASVLNGYGRGVLQADVAELRLVIRWEYAEHPRRIGRFDLDVHWPGAPQERIDAIARAADACTIHRTFEMPPQLNTTVHLG